MELTLIQSSETAMQLEGMEQIKVDRPKEKGGGGKGLMGGQYLMFGVGGCFCSTLLAAAQSRDIVIEGLRLTVKIRMSEEAAKTISVFELWVGVDKCSEPDQFSKLLILAEKGCLSVRTLKKGSEVKIVNEESM